MSKQKSHKKKQLFDDEKDNTQNIKSVKLKVNEKFAEKFEHNKRRQLLEKGKEVYGEKALHSGSSEGESSSSSIEDEDENAELINPKFEKKFLETLVMIRNNDPQLKNLQEEVFKDTDFEDDSEVKDDKQSSKPLTYKDMIRQDVLRKGKASSGSEDGNESDGSSFENNDSKRKRNNSDLFKKNKQDKETLMEEEARLKQEFKQAALKNESEEEDGEVFIKKPIEEQDEIIDNVEQLKLDDIVKKKKRTKEMKLITDKELLQRFWGDDNKLGKADKFLRNYILLEGWKEGKKNRDQIMDKIDAEDQERDEEMEAYEHVYNFRYEEPNGVYLTTHQREVQDSMRRKDEARKDKRSEKQIRKEDEKRKKQEELNRLKQIKKEEILEKLRKAEFISGAPILEDKRLLEKAEKELKTEFIPELYDRAMEKMFDEKYYAQSDDDNVENQKDVNMNLLKDIITAQNEEMKSVENDEEDKNSKEEDNLREQYERELAKPLQKQVDEQNQDYETWYVCDECMKPIEGGKYRFDCNQCDNFTFCEKCYKKNKKHLHKFTRAKVPLQQQAPKNYNELIEKSYMLCHNCKDSLINLSKRVYVCRECSGEFDKGDIMYFCLKCKKEGVHEHKLEKLKGLPGDPANLKRKDKDKMTEEEKKEYLENLLEDYYNLEYEDIIGGGSVKTRFKYKKVGATDFGLTDEEILLLDDKQLNRLVALKYLRPYMEDGDQDKVNIHRIINIKKEFKEEINEKKKMLKQALEQNVEQEKEKYFRGNKQDDEKKKLEDELKSKNKKRKERRQENDEEQEIDQIIEENDAAAKKRKRLSLYQMK